MLVRLAKANGFISAKEFCSHSGVNAFHFSQGREHEIDKVAALADLAPDVLTRFAVPKQTYVRYGLGGDVKREQLQAKGIRFCRGCLRDDVDLQPEAPASKPYFRASWRWKMISHCPKHCTPLESRSESILSVEDLSTWLKGLPEVAAQPLERSDNRIRLSVYLTSRINGFSGTEFIDTVPVDGLIDLCVLLAHFYRVANGAPVSPHVRQKMYESDNIAFGFEIVRRGRQAVWDFLTQYVQRTVDRVNNWNAVYTPVIWWLRPNLGNPEYASLVELFQEHAESSLPFEVGDVFLMQIREPKVYSLAMAAGEHGLTLERVQKVVDERWAELEAAGYHSRRALSRDVIREWLIEEKTSLGVVEARKMLACSGNLLNALVDAKVLVPSRVQKRGSRRFTLSSIQKLLRAIKARIQPTDPKRDLVSIRVIARQSENSTVEILQRILAGSVSYISCVGLDVDLESIRIDRAEFAPKSLVKSSSFLSPREAAKRFGIQRPTLAKLVTIKMLSTTDRFDPTNKSVHPYFDANEIENFLNEYISLGNIARLLKTHAPSLRKFIESCGVAPLFEKDDAALVIFYRRADAQRLGLI